MCQRLPQEVDRFAFAVWPAENWKTSGQDGGRRSRALSSSHSPGLHQGQTTMFVFPWAWAWPSAPLARAAREGAHLGAVALQHGAADLVRERVSLWSHALGGTLHIHTNLDGHPRIRPAARIKDLLYSRLPAPAHAIRPGPPAHPCPPAPLRVACTTAQSLGRGKGVHARGIRQERARQCVTESSNDWIWLMSQ
jgi:hypothetical protein